MDIKDKKNEHQQKAPFKMPSPIIIRISLAVFVEISSLVMISISNGLWDGLSLCGEIGYFLNTIGIIVCKMIEHLAGSGGGWSWFVIFIFSLTSWYLVIWLLQYFFGWMMRFLRMNKYTNKYMACDKKSG